jgi:hypothetical protein
MYKHIWIKSFSQGIAGANYSHGSGLKSISKSISKINKAKSISKSISKIYTKDNRQCRTLTQKIIITASSIIQHVLQLQYIYESIRNSYSLLQHKYQPGSQHYTSTHC